jgi:hypothetical protein
VESQLWVRTHNQPARTFTNCWAHLSPVRNRFCDADIVGDSGNCGDEPCELDDPTVACVSLWTEVLRSLREGDYEGAITRMLFDLLPVRRPLGHFIATTLDHRAHPAELKCPRSQPSNSAIKARSTSRWSFIRGRLTGPGSAVSEAFHRGNLETCHCGSGSDERAESLSPDGAACCMTLYPSRVRM